MNQRAGSYQLQLGGHSVFIPSDLPPCPAVQIAGELGERLVTARQKLAELNGVATTLPNPDLFIMMAIRKEALLSLQIEGTQATMTDVLTYETWENVDNLDAVEEVVNYIKGLQHGIARLAKQPLCFEIIKKIHRILLMSGEFRKSQNWIGPSLKNAVYVPPPPNLVPVEIGHLERFINHENGLPPLIKCALIHYQFETIHPFLDENGRVGRLLAGLFIHWKGLLQQPLIYPSLFFKQNKQEYFDRLMLVRSRGDFEQWITFFLTAVSWSASHAMEKIKAVLLLRENLRQRILKDKRASIRTVQLLEHLFLSPLTNISNIAKHLEISFQAASEQSKLLLRLSILEELTGQKRSRKFAFAPYLKIVEE